MVKLSLCLAWLGLAGTAFAGSNYMEQSWFYDWVPPSQAVPVPVTTQCETINISGDRGSATGPNPVAPYYLQVYTSAFVFPFVISIGDSLSYDWTVPFGPGTLYQICAFDKNGATGGCQRQYTVIANNTADEVTCQNATFPLGPLDIDAQVSAGPLGQYAWVDQCTDIAITPKNGTAPYTVTIAPAAHPPRNITIAEKGQTANWTVDLSWSSSFFISVVDADFNYWSYGPLHSGGGGPTDCLAQGVLTGGVSTSVVAGASVGALCGGILCGILATWLFFRSRSKQRSPKRPFTDSESIDGGYQRGSHTPILHSNTNLPSPYDIEPFHMPGENARPPPTPMSETNRRSQQQVYVVHHDGGQAPVTVYTDTGTEVVELPPRYINGDGSRSSRNTQSTAPLSQSDQSQSDAPTTTSGREDARTVTTEFLHQPRQTSAMPSKLQPLRRQPATEPGNS